MLDEGRINAAASDGVLLLMFLPNEPDGPKYSTVTLSADTCVLSVVQTLVSNAKTPTALLIRILASYAVRAALFLCIAKHLSREPACSTGLSSMLALRIHSCI